MIECPSCGVSNRPESRFCAECGEPLGVPKGLTCPMCDTANAPGVSVCTECGARLLPLGVSPSDVPLDRARPGGAEAEEGAIVDWEQIGEDAGISVGPEDETMPPWLKKLETLPGEESTGRPDEAEALASAELPEWLEVPPDFEELLGEASITVDDEDLEPGEIPSWLQALRGGEEEDAEGTGEIAAPAEVAGLLKGIRGTLGIEPILAIPRQAAPLPEVSLPSVARQRGELFGAVVREPARVGPTLARPWRVEKLAASTVRWTTYLILAAAVVVPILLGSRWSEAHFRASAGTAAMYQAIEGLPQGAMVLVSHDYDPGVAGEMMPQAKVVLDHLMRRGVRLVSVSLTPEGGRLSARVLEEVADTHGYVAGEDYLSLGYVVGVEAGPRAIVEGLFAPDWGEFVGDAGDVALVVEFAGAPEYLRLWLEQVQGPYGLPMVAGVSATADPFARPYYRNQAQHQLLGLMTGLVGAAQYEQHTGQAGPALAAMDSQSLVHVAVVLLILVGNLAYFGGRVRGRLS